MKNCDNVTGDVEGNRACRAKEGWFIMCGEKKLLRLFEEGGD